MVLEPTVWSNRLVGLLLPLPWGSGRYFPVGTLGWRVFLREGQAKRRRLREDRPEGGAPLGGRLLSGLVAPFSGHAYLTLIGSLLLNRGFLGVPVTFTPIRHDHQKALLARNLQTLLQKRFVGVGKNIFLGADGVTAPAFRS